MASVQPTVPVEPARLPPTAPVSTSVREPAPAASSFARNGDVPVVNTPPASGNARVSQPAIADADAWHDLVAASGLKGPARLLAEHAGFIGYTDGVLSLSLPASEEHLRSSMLVVMVADALSPALGAAPQIRFEAAAKPADSLHQRNQRARDQRQISAEDVFMNDPDVQRLITQHGARVVPDSIRPLDES